MTDDCTIRLDKVNHIMGINDSTSSGPLTGSYNIIIGNRSGHNMTVENYCLLIGEGVGNDRGRLPDCTIIIDGVFDGVIDTDEWRTAMRDFSDGMKGRYGAGWSNFVFSEIPPLCEKFGMHHDKVAGALAKVIGSVERSWQINEPTVRPCCNGGPQWGHAWDCPKCPD